MDANLGLGIAQAGANIVEYERGRAERDARVAEAKARAEESSQRLADAKRTAPMRQEAADMELQKQRMELQQLQAGMAKQQAYGAFQQYQNTGDTKFLNNLVSQWKTNPAGKDLLGDVVRVDPVAEQDAPLLQRSGITDVKGYLSNNPGTIVKATNADGSQTLLDMSKVYAGTGYTNYMSQAELEMKQKQALIASRMRQGESRARLSAEERVVEQLMKEDPELSWTQAYQKAAQLKNGGSLKGSTETERAAMKIKQAAAEQGEEIDDLEAMKRAVELTKPTSKQKDLGSAMDAKTTLDGLFGGAYFETDFSKPENRRKAEPYIRQIEELSGAEMNQAQLKRLSEIRQLITLGKAGTTLTDAETGPLDSMLRDAKKYISNEVQGTAATSAYEAYRNLVRNALFGASLTNNETAAFNKAFGTLGEQSGPVLAKLRTQMRMLQDELNSLYNTGDEYVMKYRTGMDVDKLNEALFALDDRLALFDNTAPEGTEVMVPTTKQQPAAQAPADRKAALQEMFK